MKRTTRAVLVSGFLGLLLAITPASMALKTADSPWSGYRIKVNASAGGSWIGARKASGRVVYRIDPSRPKANTHRLGSARWQRTTVGTGPRRASTASTARAAWIVSKYGRYRYGVQNAAVEVALNELLNGGRWGRDGAITKRRLAQTKQGTKIRRFATTMLRDSARFAGPYAVTVTPRMNSGSGTLAVTVRARATRTGAGISNLPVSATYAGQRVTGLRTSADGSASTTFRLAGTTGAGTVVAEVAKLPEARLRVRTPTTSGASRVVLAGLKTSRTVTAPVVVKVTPQIATISTSATVVSSQSPTGQLSVAGGHPSRRTATVGLFGPFDSAAAVSCDQRALVATGTINVAGNGSYALPRLSLPRYGYYIWGAILPADAYNNSATSCAGTVTVRAVPTVTATPTGAKYRSGAYIHGQVHVAGLPHNYSDNADLRLYGPFSTLGAVGCVASKLRSAQQIPISGNGTASGSDLKVTSFGYYLWAVDLPASPLSIARSSSCSTSSAVFQVTW